MTFIDYLLKETDACTNERGNHMHSAFIGDRNRYHFDFKECKSEDGWEVYSTDQDASYFGVWVHIEKRMMVTYAEGDLTVVTCPTLESFRAELKDASEFYGEVTLPSMITIDDEGKVTHYIDERPEV